MQPTLAQWRSSGEYFSAQREYPKKLISPSVLMLLKVQGPPAPMPFGWPHKTVDKTVVTPLPSKAQDQIKFAMSPHQMLCMGALDLTVVYPLQ